MYILSFAKEVSCVLEQEVSFNSLLLSCCSLRPVFSNLLYSLNLSGSLSRKLFVSQPRSTCIINVCSCALSSHRRLAGIQEWFIQYCSGCC